MISDILEITDVLKIRGLLLTVYIEKAFDSVGHQFLINVLKTSWFEKNLVRWIKILLKNQESCIINGGINTKYFKLERGTRQGDPISAYLFILVLDVVFEMSKTNQNIDKVRILEHDFLYTTYADDTTFSVKNQTSVIEIWRFLTIFQKFLVWNRINKNVKLLEIGALEKG